MLKLSKKVQITIETSSPNKILKYLSNLKINIYKINYLKNKIDIIIKKEDLKKIKGLTTYQIKKDYNLKYYLNIIPRYSLTYLIFIIIIIYLLSNIVLKIEIRTENIELTRKVQNDLDKLGITKYSILKNTQELTLIKEKLKEMNKDTIEWLNIERIGLKYIINIEQKVTKEENIPNTKCHIIASKSGIISRIYPKKGILLKEVNDYVEEGETIISGDITYNNELKGSTCASGKVYIKSWYTIDISIPKSYLKKNKTNKSRYNLEIKYNNKTKKIFKSRVENPLENKSKILNIFGLEIYLVKETESIIENTSYNEEELTTLTEKLIKEKMNNLTKNKLTILQEKVLKKEDFNSTIEESIFIVIEEEIGQVIKE